MKLGVHYDPPVMNWQEWAGQSASEALLEENRQGGPDAPVWAAAQQRTVKGRVSWFRAECALAQGKKLGSNRCGKGIWQTIKVSVPGRSSGIGQFDLNEVTEKYIVHPRKADQNAPCPRSEDSLRISCALDQRLNVPLINQHCWHQATERTVRNRDHRDRRSPSGRMWNIKRTLYGLNQRVRKGQGQPQRAGRVSAFRPGWSIPAPSHHAVMSRS